MTEKKMTRKEQREASDARIISSAINCFGENGYTHSTMVSIANGAGVTGGLLVQRFESKEKLLERAYVSVLSDTFSDRNRYYPFPECLYKLISEFKTLKKAKPKEFRFFEMIFNSRDLPEEFQRLRKQIFEERQTYLAITKAQKDGIISQTEAFLLFQAFLLQVVNQIDISDRFGITYPEDEYFFRVFNVSDEVIHESESKRKHLLDAFCMTYDALSYIYVAENRVDELVCFKEHRFMLDENDVRKSYQRFVEQEVHESDRDEMKVFLNLDTIDVRMGNRRHLTRYYFNKTGERVMFIMSVIKRNADGRIIEMVAGIKTVG